MCWSRIDWSELSLLTATVKVAAVTVSALSVPPMVTLPVTDEVRPTASVGADRKASGSRTRYPATEPAATLQAPGTCAPATAGMGTGVEGAPVPLLRASGAGALPLKSRKYTAANAAATARAIAESVYAQARLRGRGTRDRKVIRRR